MPNTVTLYENWDTRTSGRKPDPNKGLRYEFKKHPECICNEGEKFLLPEGCRMNTDYTITNKIEAINTIWITYKGETCCNLTYKGKPYLEMPSGERVELRRLACQIR